MRTVIFSTFDLRTRNMVSQFRIFKKLAADTGEAGGCSASIRTGRDFNMFEIFALGMPRMGNTIFLQHSLAP